jgi:hypothetical protein
MDEAIGVNHLSGHSEAQSVFRPSTCGLSGSHCEEGANPFALTRKSVAAGLMQTVIFRIKSVLNGLKSILEGLAPKAQFR